MKVQHSVGSTSYQNRNRLKHMTVGRHKTATQLINENKRFVSLDQRPNDVSINFLQLVVFRLQLRTHLRLAHVLVTVTHLPQMP